MKKIFVIVSMVLFLTSCGSNKAAENIDVNTDDPTVVVRKECCVDNGGVWSKNACIFDEYPEIGTGAKEYYEKCVDNRISTK